MAPTMMGFIDNVVIETVHMHVLRGVKTDIIDLVQTSFAEHEVFDALSELHTFMNMEPPPRWSPQYHGKNCSVTLCQGVD